jgi:hypothetical protein
MTYFGSFVVPPVLASATDYATWTGSSAPTNINQLLRSCSNMVLDATEGAYYGVDPLTGLATDPQAKQAMNDATCIQAAAWVALNINPLTGGVMVSGVKSSKKIGSASVTFADTTEAAAARAAAYTQLVPEAVRKLQQNNLIGTGPWTYG